MGSEVLILIIIVVVIFGLGAYMFRRPKQSDNFQRNRQNTFSGNASFSSTLPAEKEVTDPKPDVQSPRQQSQTSPPPPPQPNSGVLMGGSVTEFEDAEEDDGFSDADDEIIEELQPAIDDTQTMKAVSPRDTQELEEVLDKVEEDIILPDAPQEPKLEETAPVTQVPGGGAIPDDRLDMIGDVTDWMDDIAEEIGAGDETSLEAGEGKQDTLDVTYPEKKKKVTATQAHFSAFYPKSAQIETRHGVYIYVHAESMLEQITADAQKFKTELGGQVPQPRTSRQRKSLAHDTKVTVLLESEELEFEPDILTKRWHGDWTRYEFEFRPDAELVDDTAFVRASIMVMGFEIAKIKFAFEIVAPQMTAMAMRSADDMPDNPFARAKFESASTGGYDKIFISYSRKDKLIAEAFKIMQEAAGNEVFFDVDDIRTGEDWQAAIARAIDSADYLQLFWSENSATSEWCSYEWDYALNYRCKEDNCREFIRPVWWLNPMPAPPSQLHHLNFKQMDFETLMRVNDDGDETSIN